MENTQIHFSLVCFLFSTMTYIALVRDRKIKEPLKQVDLNPKTLHFAHLRDRLLMPQPTHINRKQSTGKNGCHTNDVINLLQ